MVKQSSTCPSHRWMFLSNHTHVLVCLGRNPDTRLRDLAERVGITERAVFRIIADLEQAGVVRRTRDGRRNHYEIEPSVKLNHPLEANRTVGALLETLLDRADIKRLQEEWNAGE